MNPLQHVLPFLLYLPFCSESSRLRLKQPAFSLTPRYRIYSLSFFPPPRLSKRFHCRRCQALHLLPEASPCPSVMISGANSVTCGLAKLSVPTRVFLIAIRLAFFFLFRQSFFIYPLPSVPAIRGNCKFSLSFPRADRFFRSLKM